MMKFISKIILILLILVIMVTSYFTYKGYRIYKNEINNKSIEQAVLETRKSDDLSFEEIDIDFINATVAVEDKRFFTRKGIDYQALIRAVIENIKARKLVQGGSTITQQIAKNLYFNHNDREIAIRIAEIFVMIDLENIYTKEELFSIYANMNYYGDGYYGLRQAAMGYFGLNADDLPLDKAALLAGIINAPSAYQLSSGYDLACKRQHKVLQTMVNNGYINEAQMQEAWLE